MATYKQIEDWVKGNHGFVPKTCWIAHVKETCGVALLDVSNSTTAPVGHSYSCCKYYDIKVLCRPYRAKNIYGSSFYPGRCPGLTNFALSGLKAKVDELLAD